MCGRRVEFEWIRTFLCGKQENETLLFAKFIWRRGPTFLHTHMKICGCLDYKASTPKKRRVPQCCECQAANFVVIHYRRHRQQRSDEQTSKMNEGSEHETKTKTLLVRRWDEKWKNCENSHSNTSRHSRREWSCTKHTTCSSSINFKLWRFSFLFSFCLAPQNNKAERWNFSSDCSFENKFNKIVPFAAATFCILFRFARQFIKDVKTTTGDQRRKIGDSLVSEFKLNLKFNEQSGEDSCDFAEMQIFSEWVYSWLSDEEEIFAEFHSHDNRIPTQVTRQCIIFQFEWHCWITDCFSIQQRRNNENKDCKYLMNFVVRARSSGGKCQ